MHARVLIAVVALTGIATTLKAAVLCARPKRDGSFNSTVKIREACKPKEHQLDPASVGFCCGGTTTTTTTATTTTTDGGPPTTTCAVVTTTTLPACQGPNGACSGVCYDGTSCVDGPGGLCACGGPPVPCGQPGDSWMCNGPCPVGMTCTLVPVDYGPGNCPGEDCGCVPSP